MQSIKRNLYLALLVGSFAGLTWACGGGTGNETAQDTVFLESGVRYIYLAKGNGRQIDSGSHVTTHINLMVGEDTIWSTHAEGQSEFSFDAKRTSLIKGFDEVVMYGKEGDRILAVIPPELGYGPEGSGVVPPNATLYFDIEMLKVEAPKIFLSDVLFEKYQSDGVEAALAAYDAIKTDSATYNLSMNEWYTNHRKLMNEGAFESAIAMLEHRLKDGAELGGYYFMAQAYDSLGNVSEALNVLERGMKSGADTTGATFMTRYINQLKSR